MWGLCKEAIGKLRKQTEEARKMAEWYETNPGKLYLPKAFEHLRNEEYITAKDLAMLVGQANSSKACRWATDNNLQSIEVRPEGGIGAPAHKYRFEDVEKTVVSMLPSDFPIYDKRTGMKYSEALLVVPLNFFNSNFKASRCMFQTISINTFNYQIGSAVAHGKSSIFSRNNYTEKDGSPINMKSHSFRYYLNYLTQRKNVDQLIIALWSTRKSVAQNRSYNCTTTEERRTMLMQSGVATMDSLALVGLDIKDPVTPLAFESRKQILELEYQTVHETRYGFCVHCYTMLPCFRQRACLDCNEHICIKGDEKKTANVKRNLEIAKEALERDRKAIAKGILGADQWFKFNEKRVERLTELVMHLENPNLPPGTKIQLVSGVYTLIEIAVEDRMALGDEEGKWLRAVSTATALDRQYVVPLLKN